MTTERRPHDQPPLAREWAKTINHRSSEAAAHQDAEQAAAFQAEQAAARRRRAIEDPMAFIASEELARDLADYSRLEAHLGAARDQAAASLAALATAEAAWSQAAEPSLLDAQVITKLRADTPRLVAQIALLEVQLADVGERIAKRRGNEESAQRRALAEELWPPIMEQLVTWVRAGLPLLAEQAATRERLYDASAWSFARGDELAFPGRYGPDELVDRLMTWLTQAERAGYGAPALGPEITDAPEVAPADPRSSALRRHKG